VWNQYGCNFTLWFLNNSLPYRHQLPFSIYFNACVAIGLVLYQKCALRCGKKIMVLTYILLQTIAEYCFIWILFIRMHMVNSITNCTTGFIYEVIHNMNTHSSHEKPCCQLQKFLLTGSQQT